MNSQATNHKVLLDVMTCAVMALDNELKVIYINQAAEVLLGLSRHRVTGTPVNTLMRGGALQEQLALAQQTDEPQAIRAITLAVAGSQQITLDCIISPQQENTEKSCSWILLELHRVDRQLKIERDKQLHQQQQAIHELVRGLAHEIKNPLGGLRGAAQLLETELGESELKEYTQIIISEADRLRKLVDNLLGPGKLPNNEMVNIHEVLEHVCNLVKAENTNSLIRVDRDYDPSIPEFLSDRGHLVQICLNIINNAVRAMDGNGVIQLRTRIIRHFTINQKCHKLVLKTDICDDGSGVPEHLQDTLFLPTVSGHADGSGLGLAIAQSLLGRHGGMIQYESKPGATCFSILIPLETGADQ